MMHNTSTTLSLPSGEQLGEQLQAFAGSLVPVQTLVKSRGRPAQLSAQLLCVGLLWCLLHGWVSQWDLWRRISGFGVAGLAPVPVSDQAVYHRLGRGGGVLMQQCAAQLSQWLYERLAPFEDQRLAPFAKQVLALDESKLDACGRWIAELRGLPAKDERLLAGRLACLFDVRRQQWVRIDWLPQALVNSGVYAHEMLGRVKARTLLLFDLGYYKFEWFDQLTQAGIWWISRLRHKGSISIQHILCQRDGYCEALVFVGDYRSDRAAYLVRLIRLRYQGVWYSYLTNVLDPTQLSGAEVVRLYGRRWDIELGFKLLKEHLGLRWLTSAKREVLAAQLWGTVALAQLLHATQVQIAAQARVEVFDVSLELLWRYWPDLQQQAARQGEDVFSLVARCGRALGLIRPNTRRRWQVPEVSWQELLPPPPDLQWLRPPRYARKPAGSRPKRASHRRHRPYS